MSPRKLQVALSPLARAERAPIVFPDMNPEHIAAPEHTCLLAAGFTAHAAFHAPQTTVYSFGTRRAPGHIVVCRLPGDTWDGRALFEGREQYVISEDHETVEDLLAQFGKDLPGMIAQRTPAASQSKINKARQQAAAIANQMNTAAAALGRFAFGVETHEDRETLEQILNSDGQPEFTVSGLRYALRAREEAEQTRRRQIEASK
jgi:hypothetical protein